MPMKYNFTEQEKQAIMSVIELDLTEYCNIDCVSCCRVCGKAPSKRYLPLTKIEEFVFESIGLDWKWRLIKLIGGEPTLHPEFFKVLHRINEYRQFYPLTNIVLMTNGLDSYKKIKDQLPNWLIVQDNSENKSKHNQAHRACYVAPIDVGEWDENNYIGCDVFRYCGMGLTNEGYFICPLGGTLKRMFPHLPEGLRALKDITLDKLFENQEQFCKLCGWYLVKTDKIYNYPVDIISPTWKKAIEEYHKRNKNNV